MFGLIIIEAAVISLTRGAGLGAATLPIVTGFGGGFLPGFHVTEEHCSFATVALVLTVASGIFPAYQAAKLPVVQALRRVE